MAVQDGLPCSFRPAIESGVVDRPGHGQIGKAPPLQGPLPAGEMRHHFDFQTEHQFTAPEKMDMPYGPEALQGTIRWPGTGMQGDPTLDQVIASSRRFLSTGSGSDAQTLGRARRRAAGQDWTRSGDGTFHGRGSSCWIYCRTCTARTLRVGILAVEPAGPPFGAMTWGLTASPVAYDPPVADPSELKTVDVKPAEDGRAPYKLQAEPAHKLKNLQNVPIASHYIRLKLLTIGPMTKERSLSSNRRAAAKIITSSH